MNNKTFLSIRAFTNTVQWSLTEYTDGRNRDGNTVVQHLIGAPGGVDDLAAIVGGLEAALLAHQTKNEKVSILIEKRQECERFGKALFVYPVDFLLPAIIFPDAIGYKIVSETRYEIVIEVPKSFAELAQIPAQYLVFYAPLAANR